MTEEENEIAVSQHSDGTNRWHPDALAALQRRYIGYQFTSRHPKGQISTGEIRDVIVVASELVAKIKWKGQRALDVQKLADLIGIPQRELEASAGRDAIDHRILPAAPSTTAPSKASSPVPIAPRLTPNYDMGMVRSSTPTFQKYFPPRPLTASQLTEDRPLIRRREYVGKKLVKRLPPDGFRVGQVLDVFRDLSSKKLMATVMWEGDSAPTAQTVDSVRRLLQSTETEKRFERWVGETPEENPLQASSSAYQGLPVNKLEQARLMLETRRHDFIGKVIVNKIDDQIVTGRVSDVFHDSEGTFFARVKWGQDEESVTQTFESMRKLLRITENERRLEKWVLRTTNDDGLAGDDQSQDEDSMQSTYFQRASIHSTDTGDDQEEVMEISDDSPSNTSNSKLSIKREALLQYRRSNAGSLENDGSESDDGESDRDSGLGMPCMSCADAGLSNFTCRVQLKHNAPNWDRFTIRRQPVKPEYQESDSTEPNKGKNDDGDSTPKRIMAPSNHAAMQSQMLFPPAPNIALSYLEQTDPNKRTRGLTTNEDGSGLKTCAGCKNAGLTPYICRVRLHHQTANWDHQALQTQFSVSVESQNVTNEAVLSNDSNSTRSKYLGRKFVKIKRSGEYAMGVVVDIYPGSNSRGARRWVVLVENEDGSRVETSMDALLRLLRATQKENRFAALEQQRGSTAAADRAVAEDRSVSDEQVDDDEELAEQKSVGNDDALDDEDEATSQRPATRRDRQFDIVGQRFVKYQRSASPLVGIVQRVLPRQPGDKKLMCEVEYENGTNELTSLEAAKKLVKATQAEHRFAHLNEMEAANSDEESSQAVNSGDDDSQSRSSIEGFNGLQREQRTRSRKRSRVSTPQKELFDLSLALELGCISSGQGVLSLALSSAHGGQIVAEVFADGMIGYDGQSFSSLPLFLAACEEQFSCPTPISFDCLKLGGRSFSDVSQELDEKKREAENSCSAPNRRPVVRASVPAKSKRSEVLDLDVFPENVRDMLGKYPELDCNLDAETDEKKHAKLVDRLEKLETQTADDAAIDDARTALVRHFRTRLETVGFDKLNNAELEIIRLHNLEHAVRHASQHREALQSVFVGKGIQQITSSLPLHKRKVKPIATLQTVGAFNILPSVVEATSMVDDETRADELRRSGTQLMSKRGPSEAKKLNDAQQLRVECEYRLVDLDKEERELVSKHDIKAKETSQILDKLVAEEEELAKALEQLRSKISEHKVEIHLEEREFEIRKRRCAAHRQHTEKKHQKAITRYNRARANLDALDLFMSYVTSLPIGSRLGPEILTLMENAVDRCEAQMAAVSRGGSRFDDATVRLLYEAIRLIARLCGVDTVSGRVTSLLQRLEQGYQSSNSSFCLNPSPTNSAKSIPSRLLAATNRNCTMVLFDVKTLQHQVPKRMPERVARVLKVMKRVQEFAVQFQNAQASAQARKVRFDQSGTEPDDKMNADPDLIVRVFGEDTPTTDVHAFWECVLLAHSEQYIDYLFERTNLARDTKLKKGEIFKPVKDLSIFHAFDSESESESEQKPGMEIQQASPYPVCFVNSVYAPLPRVTPQRMESARSLDSLLDTATVLLWDRWKEELWHNNPTFADALDYVCSHSDLEIYNGQDGREISDDQLRVLMELRNIIQPSRTTPGGSSRKNGKRKGKRTSNGGGAPVDDVWMALKPFVGAAVRVPEYDGTKYLYGTMVWDQCTNRPAVELADGTVASFYQFEFKAGRRDRNPKKKVQIELPIHSWTTIMDVPTITQMHSEEWESELDIFGTDNQAAAVSVSNTSSSSSLYTVGNEAQTWDCAPAEVSQETLTHSTWTKMEVQVQRSYSRVPEVSQEPEASPVAKSERRLTSLSVEVVAENSIVRTVTPSHADEEDEQILTAPKRRLPPAEEPLLKIAKTSNSVLASGVRRTIDNAASMDSTTTEDIAVPVGSSSTIVTGPGWWEELEFAGSDTFISADSLNAALAAAMLACRGVNTMITGILEEDPTKQPSLVRNVFCVTRPPGHHAGRYGNTRGCSQNGFCLLNNVAIAAFYARVWHGLKRVAIVDIDAHFGNGTAELFDGDQDAFYASVHLQYETPSAFFPSSEGVRLGEDKNSDNQVFVNVYPPKRWNNPFIAQDDRLRGRFGFRRALVEKVLPALERFGPDIVFISAGFDGFEGDPLGSGLGLKPIDFEWTAQEIIRAADRFCGGKVVAVLEGGYDVSNATDGLARCTEAFINGMTLRT